MVWSLVVVTTFLHLSQFRIQKHTRFLQIFHLLLVNFNQFRVIDFFGLEAS